MFGFFCNGIHISPFRSLPSKKLPVKMISAALAEIIAIFLKGVGAAVQVYRCLFSEEEE